MTDSITVTGMILSAQPMGEYDRRLVFLTKERGKIAAFAKGVRRPTAALSGVGQPFVFGRFTLFEGKNSYTLQAADVENYFSGIRSDLKAVYYGVYFCEFADAVTREGINAGAELKVLYRSLGALLRESIGMELVRCIFEMKMLCVSGVSPQVCECVRCKSKEDLTWFSAKAGGCICKKCVTAGKISAEEHEDLCPVSPSTLYTMQFILATPIESLYTFTVKPEVLKELQMILIQFLKVHIGRQFHSIEMLEEL